MIGKRKTARPWAKRGTEGTAILAQVEGTNPKVVREKRKITREKRTVSKNHESDDQKMFEQFLRKTALPFTRIPDLAYYLLFSPSAPTYSHISDGQRALLSSYLAGLPDTHLHLRLGNSPFMVSRAIEQKVKGRHMDHRQELKAATYGTTECQTVEESIKCVNELRTFRDKVAELVRTEAIRIMIDQ